MTLESDIQAHARVDAAARINDQLPPWITAEITDGQLALIYRSPLPVHVLRTQEEIVPLRGQRVVLANGEVVKRSFYNPITAGNSFHTAWQRLTKMRKPIKYVLEDATPYVRRLLTRISFS